MHSSSQSGGEQEFYGHAPLMARPEAHNIDVHASLLDPFGQFVVRTFKQRSLVLLLSDFHFPLPEITRMMDALLKHDFVPVVLWQERECDAFPDWGLLRLRDLESGQNRPLLMRPSLKAKIRRQFIERRQQLRHIFYPLRTAAIFHR